MESQNRVFRFGPYLLNAKKRQLLRGSEPVKLYPKEFDTLLALVNRRGEVVEKDELLRAVWPAATVEEGNLATHVSHLRKVLGDGLTNRDYIVTIPGRGYEFVAQVTEELPEDKSIEVTPQPRAVRRRVPVKVAVGSLLAVVVAMTLLATRNTRGVPPSFQQLTFRRGTLWSARFGPDGQTIVYGAAWDGHPIELFSTRPGSTESTPLGQRADVLSIAGSGEMAISLDRQFSRLWESRGTLARVPLAGGAPREVRRNVKDADWSPDGRELAIVERVQGRDMLQFPEDHPLHEVQGFIVQPRVSRDGASVAFLQRSAGSESVELVTRDGSRATLAGGLTGTTGLAWSSTGTEVLFTTTDRGSTTVRAVTTSGRQRVVLQAAGEWKLNDVAPDGRALMSQDFRRGHIMGARQGDRSERDLSWLDASVAVQLSADGQLLVLAEIGAGGGTSRSTYIRKMDGSPAVRLGDGEPAALSPDGQSVIAIRGAAPERLVLLPTGPGTPRDLQNGPIMDYYMIKWLPDNRHIVMGAIASGQPLKIYMQDTRSGVPTPLDLQPPVGPVVFLSDGATYVARNSRREYSLFHLGRRDSQPVPGISDAEFVVQATPDDRSLFVLHPEGITLHVDRVDLLTGARIPHKSITIEDPAGVQHPGPEFAPFLITPDGTTYAYSYLRVLSNLYLVQGLR